MNLRQRLVEIEARLAEIRSTSTNENEVEKLSAFETECDELQNERAMIQKKLQIETKSEVKPLSTTQKVNNDEVLEKRGIDLKEKRIIKVSSDEILLSSHVSPTLTEVPYKEVSSLIDKVKTVNLTGGETYIKSYVKKHGIAGLTSEGGAYHETESDFGYVTITKVKVTAYTEITEELEKLPAIPYQSEVLKNINISLKKKLSQQIIKGNGESNAFTGIFSDKATALENSDLEIEAITDSTLDDIIYSYGGDEEVESGACLILNKNDLRAFAKLKTPEGRKVHNIDYLAETIDGIPYVINSNCKSLNDPGTLDGEYTMAYGALTNYEVPIFSPVEVCKSTDYKFKDGIICYKASLFSGGNVVGYNGFLRIKKKVSE